MKQVLPGAGDIYLTYTPYTNFRYDERRINDPLIMHFKVIAINSLRYNKADNCSRESTRI